MNDSGVIYQDNGLNLSAGTLSRPKPNLLRDHCQTFMQPTRLKHVESKRGIHGHKFRKKREKIKIWGKERVARWLGLCPEQERSESLVFSLEFLFSFIFTSSISSPLPSLLFRIFFFLNERLNPKIYSSVTGKFILTCEIKGFKNYLPGTTTK